MRSVRAVAPAALALGLAALGFRAIRGAENRVGPQATVPDTLAHPTTARGPVPAIEPRLAGTPLRAEAFAGDPVTVGTPAAQMQAREAVPDPPERRRRSRWRNRYPGPIPTPADWQPPEGPVRIALQAGHWRASEAPSELRGLRDNGTSALGEDEWEVNLRIVRKAAERLEALGYEVDVLPAVVPPGYRAHLFVAIHADGSVDPATSGFRVAAPRRDATGRAGRFAELLESSYGEVSDLRRLPRATRRMSNYYAFNFRRYQHALHPMTIAVIIETGFLTSPLDRRVIVDDPDRAARGIVDAVVAFEETPPPGG